MSATRTIPPGPTDTARGGGTAALLGAFGPPRWLRDIGISAWLVAGVLVLLVALFWALAAAQEIVGPLIAGGIVATVASPLVSRLKRHHVGRGWGSLIVLLAL
ncbi:MAG TPA: hypothetical protein VLN26_00525, partial [Gaiellaceae bacterium]|nr:hypothetical protein [Gaiellaceae bacterium]